MPDDVELEPGDRIALRGPEGERAGAWAKEVNHEVVVVDVNHPYAGKDLQFEVFVVSVRDSTEAERDQEAALR